MPTTKKEKILFSVVMAAVMVYGMEVYNHFLLHTLKFPKQLFLSPVELVLLMLTVIVLETLIGGPIARKIAFWLVRRPSKPIIAIVAVQICTVCLMCPMMSFVASIVFKNGFSGGLFFIWLGTVRVNFLMALLWQLLVAGPLVRFLVLKIPRKMHGDRQVSEETIPLL